MDLNEIYYIVMNKKEGIINVFDENNLEYIPKGYKSIAKIVGDNNCSEVLKLLLTIIPNFKQAQPFS